MAHWGIWNSWPFKEGKTRYAAMNGYGNVQQLTAPGVEINPSELNLDLTLEQVGELMQKTRESVSIELWELVDYVIPEE